MKYNSGSVGINFSKSHQFRILRFFPSRMFVIFPVTTLTHDLSRAHVAFCFVYSPDNNDDWIDSGHITNHSDNFFFVFIITPVVVLAGSDFRVNYRGRVLEGDMVKCG